MRERQAHCYYLPIYYGTKMLTQLPLDAFVPILFASIVYWVVGLNPDPMAFLIFLGLTVLVSLSAIGLGMIIGACAPNIDAANALAPLIMVLMILFGGFYINCWYHIFVYFSLMKCFEMLEIFEMFLKCQHFFVKP